MKSLLGYYIPADNCLKQKFNKYYLKRLANFDATTVGASTIRLAARKLQTVRTVAATVVIA